MNDEQVAIRAFIEGVNNVKNNNLLELTKKSLVFLKTTPALKDVILEFYCTLFNKSVRTCITNIEDEVMGHKSTSADSGNSELEETAIAEVHSTLCNFITTKPEVWAPIVSTWALQLLGTLSTKYAGRGVSETASLSEVMNLWMGCRATRTLMDITTQCLSCLIDSDTESCISALLDSSVKHSPHFDWVVAHVGNCFPDTVITRVLSCGLKDFSQHYRGGSQSSANRLNSIVGILDHLATSHFNDIRNALLDLFQKSLQPVGFEADSKLLKKITVPYLLQLASTSFILRKALTTNIQQTVSVQIIPQLAAFVSDWGKYFESSDAFMDLIVRLALGCEHGGIQIINLLLDCILAENLPFETKEVCRLLLENIILEVDTLVRSGNKVEILMSIGKDLHALQQMLIDSNKLKQTIASRLATILGVLNPAALILVSSYLLRKAKTDTQLLILVRILSNSLNATIGESNESYGGYLGRAIEHAIGFATMHLEEEDEIFTFVTNDQINEELELGSQRDASANGKKSLNGSMNQSNGGDVAERDEILWLNILKLLQWEKTEIERTKLEKEKPTIKYNIFENLTNEKQLKNLLQQNEPSKISPTLLSGQNVSKAIFDNLMEISLIFGDCLQNLRTSHITADLLVTLNVPCNDHTTLNPLSLELVLHLTTVTVRYFFACCTEEDPYIRAACLNKACVILNRLCSNMNAARILALRELLEHSLFKPQAFLFGAKFNPNKSYDEELLLYQNLKQGTSTLLQRDSSIFHAGVIGTGCRKSVANNTLDKNVITNNTTWLIRAIESCCISESELIPKDSEDDRGENEHEQFPPISWDGMEKVALMLVEYVSSDVMYNGLPWPDEEHMKVTIERDLHIRRLFTDIPLLWNLMFMLTKYPPSVCLCSVLLRALTATLLHQWNSLGGNRRNEEIVTREQPHVNTLTEQTIQVLDLMAMGQILPKPLSNIRDVVASLTPNEVVQLLRECVWSYMRPNEHVPSPLLFKVNAHGQYYRDPEVIRPSSLYTDTLRLTLQRNIDKLGEQFWFMFDTSADDEEDSPEEVQPSEVESFELNDTAVIE